MCAADDRPVIGQYGATSNSSTASDGSRAASRVPPAPRWGVDPCPTRMPSFTSLASSGPSWQVDRGGYDHILLEAYEKAKLVGRHWHVALIASKDGW
jgi:hypothetical protein